MIDRRVQRSRQQLHAALVELILERGWDRVSVQAVCERAGVGRSTFYVHFADKEDLLIGGLDHVRDELLRARPRQRRPFGFVRGMIDHADRSRQLFRAVIGKRSGLAVQRKFREVVLELVREDLEANGVGKSQLAATSRFLAGAFVELLIGWVDGSAAGTAEELERTFVRLATPVLR
jgi:AcrR family transcriptional regulator